jgi:hypothetical protein
MLFSIGGMKVLSTKKILDKAEGREEIRPT